MKKYLSLLLAFVLCLTSLAGTVHAALAENENEAEETEAAQTEEAENTVDAAGSRTYDDHDTVLSVQAELIMRGYNCGDKDGKVGTRTLDQIERYRSDMGLNVNRKIGDELLFSLGIADSATLKAVQEALTELGYDCGTPDGLTGRKSREAIQQYRLDHSLPTAAGVDLTLLGELGIEH